MFIVIKYKINISESINFDGSIKWDKSKPDGTPRKLIDSSKINSAGWNAKIDLTNGIESVYKSKF